MNIEFFGVRGSAPAYINRGTSFGVNTSCALVRAGDRVIVLDAGTGALTLGDLLAGEKCDVDLLLSHMHIDHLQGLPFFTPLFQKGRNVNVYSEARVGMDTREQLDLFTSSPLWPIRFSTFPANIVCHTLKRDETFSLGADVTVETRRSNHPDVSTMFRISCGGRTLVYALDYEHECEDMTLLRDFARGANLTVFDATYSDSEYASKKGWGHSTWQKGRELALSGECGRVALSHLSHASTDAALFEVEKELSETGGMCMLAKEGMALEV